MRIFYLLDLSQATHLRSFGVFLGASHIRGDPCHLNLSVPHFLASLRWIGSFILGSRRLESLAVTHKVLHVLVAVSPLTQLAERGYSLCGVDFLVCFQFDTKIMVFPGFITGNGAYVNLYAWYVSICTKKAPSHEAIIL